MHNGSIARFQEVKRELILAVAPSLYANIEGSTDSEVLFFLALTFGLAEDPPAAVERAVCLIERLGQDRGIEDPIRLTVAASDGQKVWVFRYSTSGRSSSLFYSSDVTTLRAHYPDNLTFHNLSSDTRLVVSEPLSDLAGVWNEVPESSYGVIGPGQDELKSFNPENHRK
jgi:glutamine amidotransferase